MLWCVAYHLMVSERPEDHPRISEAELAYLQSDTISQTAKSKRTPWAKILGSGRAWVLHLMLLCQQWGNLTMHLNLPSFIDETFNYGILTVIKPFPFTKLTAIQHKNCIFYVLRTATLLAFHTS